MNTKVDRDAMHESFMGGIDNFAKSLSEVDGAKWLPSERDSTERLTWSRVLIRQSDKLPIYVNLDQYSGRVTCHWGSVSIVSGFDWQNRSNPFGLAIGRRSLRDFMDRNALPDGKAPEAGTTLARYLANPEAVARHFHKTVVIEAGNVMQTVARLIAEASTLLTEIQNTAKLLATRFGGTIRASGEREIQIYFNETLPTLIVDSSNQIGFYRHSSFSVGAVVALLDYMSKNPE